MALDQTKSNLSVICWEFPMLNV